MKLCSQVRRKINFLWFCFYFSCRHHLRRINIRKKIPRLFIKSIFRPFFHLPSKLENKFLLYKFSLTAHDLNNDRIRNSCVRWQKRVGWLWSRSTSIISAILEASSRQQQTTCCTIAGLFIFQIDAAPCEIRIYYRRIVIPFLFVLFHSVRGMVKIFIIQKRERWRRREKNENGTVTKTICFDIIYCFRNTVSPQY